VFPNGKRSGSNGSLKSVFFRPSGARFFFSFFCPTAYASSASLRAGCGLHSFAASRLAGAKGRSHFVHLAARLKAAPFQSQTVRLPTLGLEAGG